MVDDTQDSEIPLNRAQRRALKKGKNTNTKNNGLATRQNRQGPIPGSQVTGAKKQFNRGMGSR